MAGYQVDREKWAQLSFCEQMGNVSSEVGRAISAKKAGKESRCNSAIDRACDLFDATVECLVLQKSYRTKEVLRAREQFLALFFNNTFDSDADSIEKYFSNFALLARK